MNKNKITLVLLLVFLVAIVGFLYITKIKQNNQTVKNTVALPFKDLGNGANDPGDLKASTVGKIKTIGEKELVIENETPLNQLTKNNENPRVSVKLTNATAVFFLEKEKSNERKQLSDLRVGDLVRVEYNNLTKDAVAVSVSVGGADFVDEASGKN